MTLSRVQCKGWQLSRRHWPALQGGTLFDTLFPFRILCRVDHMNKLGIWGDNEVTNEIKPMFCIQRLHSPKKRHLKFNKYRYKVQSYTRWKQQTYLISLDDEHWWQLQKSNKTHRDWKYGNIHLHVVNAKWHMFSQSWLGYRRTVFGFRLLLCSL